MSSFYAQIINYSSFFLRDILTLLAQITLSVYSTALFKRFLSDRSLQLQLQLQQANAINQPIAITYTLNTVQIATPTSYRSSAIESFGTFSKRIIRMSIYMSVFSIWSHVAIALGYLFNEAGENSLWSSWMNLVALLLTLSTCISNFFFLYIFNTRFSLSVNGFSGRIASVFVSAFGYLSFILFDWLLNLVLD